MPLVNLLNCIDVAAIIHENSLVFFLDRVFQAIERQSAGKVQMEKNKLPLLIVSQNVWPYVGYKVVVYFSVLK